MATVLVGTGDGLHLVAAGATPVRGLDRREVGALAAGPDAAWAVVDGAEVWRVPAGRPDEGVLVAASVQLHLNCLAVAGGELLAGTAGAHLLRLEAGMLRQVEAFDRAEGRDGWYTPWGGPPDLRSLAVGPDGLVWANVHVGGILRGDDGGRAWTPTIEVDADVHQVLAAPPPGRVLAATARGLAVSGDTGRTWAFQTEGLHAGYCRAVAVAGDTVLVSCSTGPRGQRAAVYRRPLEAGPGTPFERCRAGLPAWFDGTVDTACLQAAGSTVALGTAAGEVYLSEDAGATWRLLAGDLPPVRCLLLAG